MEDNRLHAPQEELSLERETGDDLLGYTLYFRAPLGVNEEEVQLHFEDVTKSNVRCQKIGCVMRAIFSDNEALQRARNVSSYTIDNECALIPLPSASAILSPATDVSHPSNSSSVSSADPHGGEADCETGAVTAVLKMNVDCQEHITKYCMKDFISYLNVSWCVIRRTEVPGVLLLEYNPSTSQFDVAQIVKKMYEYSQKFTTIIVALPEHLEEKSLEHLLGTCCLSWSFIFVGNFSGSQLYKICCQTTYAPKLQQYFSLATKVPFISCCADSSGNGGPERKAEGYLGDVGSAVKSDPPASVSVAKTVTAEAPVDVLAPRATKPIIDATRGVTAQDLNETCAAVQAPIASHTGSTIPESLLSVGAPDCSGSANLPAVSQLLRSSPAVTSFSAAVADAAVLSATRDYQSATASLELRTSADGNVEKTTSLIDNDNCTTPRSDRLDAALDYLSLTIPTDGRAQQLFKKSFETHLREDLEKLFPVAEPRRRVEFTYDDEVFKFCGNRDSVLKAKALLYTLFEMSGNKSLLETSRVDGSTLSQRIGKADTETVHDKSKLHDVPTIDRAPAGRGNDGVLELRAVSAIKSEMPEERLKDELKRPTINRGAADRESNGLLERPAFGAAKSHMHEERFTDELQSKFNEEAGLIGAAPPERDASDKHRRHYELVESTDSRSISDCLLLELEMGSVAEQTADVLVNSVDPQLTLSSGSISRSILDIGGPDLQQDLRRNYRDGIKEFQFATTPGFRLPCKVVLHVACGRYNGSESEKKFLHVISECLKCADELKMKSIVFPAIGAGVLGYPPATVVKLLHNAVNSFSNAFPKRNLKSVKCVVYDRLTYDAFKSALVKLLRDDRGDLRKNTDDSSFMAAGRGHQSAITSLSAVKSFPTGSGGARNSGVAAGSAGAYSYEQTGLLPSQYATSLYASSTTLPSETRATYQQQKQMWDAHRDQQVEKKHLDRSHPLEGSNMWQTGDQKMGRFLEQDPQQYRMTEPQQFLPPSSSLAAHQSTTSWSGVVAGSRTPISGSMNTTTSWGHSQAKSTVTTSQPATFSSGSSKNISDWKSKKY